MHWVLDRHEGPRMRSPCARILTIKHRTHNEMPHLLTERSHMEQCLRKPGTE